LRGTGTYPTVHDATTRLRCIVPSALLHDCHFNHLYDPAAPAIVGRRDALQSPNVSFGGVAARYDLEAAGGQLAVGRAQKDDGRHADAGREHKLSRELLTLPRKEVDQEAFNTIGRNFLAVRLEINVVKVVDC